MRLSVIIPGYNTPHALWKRCVDSVLVALPEDSEVVCVDDGSTREKMPQFEDSRVRQIFLPDNVGQAKARNVALAESKGEWITFVDSDDTVEHDIYETALASSDGADVVAFGVRAIWPDIRLIQESAPDKRMPSYMMPSDVERMMRQCLFEYPVNKLFRTEFLREHHIWFPEDVCPGEDTLFNLSCVEAEAKWAAIEKIGYNYFRFDGTSLSRYMPRLKESLIIRRKRWRAYKDSVHGAYDALGCRGENSDRGIALRQWENIWRHGSTYSLSARWRWLKENSELVGVNGRLSRMAYCFFRQSIRNMIRKHLYFAPIRRRHVVAALRKWNPNMAFRIGQWPE